MAEILGNKDNFTPPTNDPTPTPEPAQNVEPQKTEPTQQVAPQISKEEYERLKQYEAETRGLIEGLTKLPAADRVELVKKIAGLEQSSGSNFPQAGLNPMQNAEEFPQRGEQLYDPNKKIPEETAEFLETFPGAKAIFDENQRLKQEINSIKGMVGQVTQAEYERGVREMQMQIDAQVKQLKNEFKDGLNDDDITRILNEAAGISYRNPNQIVDIYNLGKAYAERIGITKAQEQAMKDNQVKPDNSEGEKTGTSQQPIVYKNEEMSSFDDIFDKAYGE